MKKIFTILTLMVMIISAHATHLMGGQITTQPFGGNMYEIKLTLYRDVLGIPISPSQDVYVQFPGGSFTVVTVYHTGAVNFLNGVEEYTYMGIFQTGITGQHNIYWTQCCRNQAILNLPNPGGNSFALVNEFMVDTIAGNSSPVFLNPPVVIAELMDPFTYNPLPFDADGDSLAWSLVTPLDAPTNNPVINPPFPIPGYILPNADVSGPFTMDPATGAITWVPNTLGNFVASFIVEEFRNGIKIGEIRRDMQYIVVDIPGANNRAYLNSNGWPVGASGVPTFEVQENTPFTMSVVAMDDDGDVINIAANGEPFILSSNAAQFVTYPSSPGLATADFNWSATTSEARIQPYMVAFRIFETVNPYVLVSDHTVMFKVGNFLSVDEYDGVKIGNAYPVPSAGSIYLPIFVDRSETIEISVVNALGQQVNSINKKLNSGNNLIFLHNMFKSPGIYWINIIKEGKIIKSEKILIQ